jgi:hypothetical protein
VKCGGALLPTGICSACGYNALVELEIGAFMAPHINRARIVLVVVGVLYAFIGYKSYGDVNELRKLVNAWAANDSDPRLAELQSKVTLIYASVVFVLASGVANIVLAAIAGKKTMLAFNIAAGIFLVHTCLQLYVTKGVIFTSWVWWLTAIVLAMGYQAARKAYLLRKEADANAAPAAA